MSSANTSLKVSHGKDSLVLGNDLFECTFNLATAGFPSTLRFSGYEHPVLSTDLPMMRAGLASGAKIRPVLATFNPAVYHCNETVRILFNDIKWQDESGEIMPGYRLALNYELNPDGIAFVRTFFCVESPGEEKINTLILEPSLMLAPGEQANWALWKFPERVDARLIQNFGATERYLKQGEARHLNHPAPMVTFDFGRGGRRDHHLEFFLESNNSLSTPYHNDNSSTDIRWQGRQAKICWDFQNRAVKLPRRAYYWRNTWGWGIRRWQTKRKHPPFREYHYLDLKKHYPSDEIIRQAAEEGANLFTCHENWRLDLKNGEFPHSLSGMQHMVDALHSHGIRFCPYVRGNEDNIRESGGAALAPWVTPDFDGIYADYGSPISYQAAEEFAPGSRIHFYEHYQTGKKIRQRVGERGVYTSHSGSFFCATGHASCDAYVGGEQEKGRLLEDQTTYAYFSGLAVAPPALWTAAFPTYRHARALPYLATSLSTPFLALGTQFPRSSLDITQYPSLIHFARPLWRLYELFDGMQDIQTHSTFYSGSPITTDSKQTGVSVMIGAKQEVLIIASNFSSRSRNINLSIDWAKMGVCPGKNTYALSVGYESCSHRKIDPPKPFTARLDGHGLCGWLMVDSTKKMRDALKRFDRPYPDVPELSQLYAEKLAAIKKLRFEPPPWKQTWLRLSLPANTDTFEHSIFYDLYMNFVELHDLSVAGKPRRIAYLSKRGATKHIPVEKDYILPGDQSPWIPLHKLISPARKRDKIRLALATRRGSKGEHEFYNFYYAHLSPHPKISPQSRELIYNPDIDSDWSVLDFCVSPADS